MIQLKKEGIEIPDDDAKVGKNKDEYNIAESYLSPDKNKKKKGNKVTKGPDSRNQSTIRKAFKDEEDDEAEIMKAKAQGAKAKKGPANQDTDEKSGEE